MNTDEKYGRDNPRFRTEFDCVNDLLFGESYICGSNGFINDRDSFEEAEALCKLLNDLYNENLELKRFNTCLVHILAKNNIKCDEYFLRKGAIYYEDD